MWPYTPDMNSSNYKLRPLFKQSFGAYKNSKMDPSTVWLENGAVPIVDDCETDEKIVQMTMNAMPNKIIFLPFFRNVNLF